MVDCMNLNVFANISLTNVQSARECFAQLNLLAQENGVMLRQTPLEPQHCCGRGCNGCVWEGFFHAAHYWIDDAVDTIQRIRP
jgi:Oxidoreductase-like protein, N-terminal